MRKARSVQREQPGTLLKIYQVGSAYYHRVHVKPVVLFLACEQALLFGRVKRVSQERASERRSPLAPRQSPSALGPSAPRPLTRAFSWGSLRLPKYQIRELARRLYFFPPTLKSMCIIFSVGKEKSYQQLWRSTEDFSRWHSLNRVVRHNNHSLLSTVLFRAI